MVYGFLQALSQGLEEHRDQAGRQQRDKQVATGLQQVAWRDDDQYVQCDDAGCKCAIDQGAVDDEVDVPQSVAQNSDAY